MQAIHDQREIDERNEHDIEFFKPREEALKSLEPAEQSFYFIASSLIHGAIVLPWRASIVLGWHYKNNRKSEASCRVVSPYIRPRAFFLESICHLAGSRVNPPLS